MIGRAQELPAYHVLSTPIYTGFPAAPMGRSHMKDALGQVTPPLRMIESPGLIVVELQTLVQECIPGAFFHGDVF
jgi:hypothetical protein